MIFGQKDSACDASVQDTIWNDPDVRQTFETLRMRGASSDEALREVARQVKGSGATDQLPSDEHKFGRAMSLWSALSPPFSIPLVALLSLVGLVTAGYALGIFGD